MKQFCYKVIPTFIFLVLSSAVFAQSGNTSKQVTNELLEVRNKLEKEIQENLQNLIGTQLNPETYTVAVRVNVSPIAPPEVKKKETISSEGPAGLDLGVISAQELAEAYEREIEELKLKKAAAEQKETTKYQIGKIEVIVGLDSTYDKEYVAQFDSWLKGKIKKDYGSLGSSMITVLPKKYEAPEKEIKPEDPMQPKYLSLIAAALLLMVGMLLLGVLLRSGLNKVATATKGIQLDPLKEFKVEGLPGPVNEQMEEPVLEAPPQKAESYNPGEEIDSLIKKIAFLVIELGSKANDLVNVWIDSGDEGFVKTAVLVDTVLTARERILSQSGNLASIQIPLTEDVARMYEENLAEAYRLIVDMKIEERISLLEKVYWDLVSITTLGLKSLRRPFDYMQNMTLEEVQSLLASQKHESQALAIMYLPEDMKFDLMSNLPEDNREKVVQHALLQSHISDKEIWDADTSVKVTTLNQSGSKSEKLVNLFPRTLEVLQSLDILEEIRILRKVTPSLQDQGISLKQQYSTLAFIDEWKKDYVDKLVAVATAEEVVILVRLIPAAKDTLLLSCSEKIRTIIEDDLKLAPSNDDAKIKQKLSGLKNKWNKIAAAEQIPMNKVIIAPTPFVREASNAAA